MSKNLQYWKDFWETQSTPCHRYNTPEWYDRYAREINLILESVGYQGGSVMETGCGNGALFDSLHINKIDYVGTDISESLVELFQIEHPELKILCTDSASYTCDRKFSLIFSNGVVQYFDRDQFDLYIKNSLAMLEPNGILLFGNVLLRNLKPMFASGEFSGRYTSGRRMKAAKFRMREVFGNPSMGYWHSPRDFVQYQTPGIEMQVFGSLFHPYRFSLVLKKVSGTAFNS
jgi:cyclopropane fatty-acyl-phospholipid synthase-like methyltransferase